MTMYLIHNKNSSSSINTTVLSVLLLILTSIVKLRGESFRDIGNCVFASMEDDGVSRDLCEHHAKDS